GGGGPRARRRGGAGAPPQSRGNIMLQRSLLGAIAVAVLVSLTSAARVAAQVTDDSKYPDFQGQWRRTSGIQWDPQKRLARAQDPPLTGEDRARFAASLADQAKGGQGNDPTYKCIPAGMPRIMTAVFPMEIIIAPKTTYILSDYATPRRIYTDGRSWPKDLDAAPTFLGYSIGKWIDADGDGRYDTLEIETRGMKGPRSFEASGIPLHEDNQTVVKERIYLDRGNPDTLINEITTIDNALTRPWTVTKRYRREPNPVWYQ